jgi:hypothetical protein
MIVPGGLRLRKVCMRLRDRLTQDGREIGSRLARGLAAFQDSRIRSQGRLAVFWHQAKMLSVIKDAEYLETLLWNIYKFASSAEC